MSVAEDPADGAPEIRPRVFKDRPNGGESHLFGSSVRPLTPAEIVSLESGGSRADDWSKLLVTDGFDPAFVSGVRFRGAVVIGAMGRPVERASGLKVASGLYDATIADSELGDGVLVDRVGLLHRTIVDTGARIVSTQEITHTAGSSFGNGQVLDLVCHPGGRRVAIRADLPFSSAAAQAGNAITGLDVDARAREDSDAWASAFAYIGEGASIEAAGRLDSCWIGPGAVVRNARAVERSTVLSSPDEATRVLDGVVVQDSLLQWSSRISGSAFVQQSLVCEGTVVERHAMVVSSVVGPDSVIAEGEVSKSLVGPLVGFHHQALLVAAYWPEGRGNVGYGANVGSNHTGKAPDQEIRPGEGAFFGLGVNIKFPTDFSRAPYILIATGVDTLPQRITMPFALVATPIRVFEGVTGAYQEIRPGWVLSQNPYSLLRNELKFGVRHRALRDRVSTSVMRPELIDEVSRAAGDLERLSGRPWYTDRHLEGLGKNVMSEEARVDGLSAYRTCLRRYGLRAAFARLLAGRSLDPPPDGADPEWLHASRVLTATGLDPDPIAVVRMHAAETTAWAESVADCKRRDDERGARIIEDYADVHPAADLDEVVIRGLDIARDTQTDADRLLRSMGLS